MMKNMVVQKALRKLLELYPKVLKSYPKRISQWVLYFFWKIKNNKLEDELLGYMSRGMVHVSVLDTSITL